MSEIQVDLVTAERQVWSGRAQMVVARTVEGDIGIMPGHAPLLGLLREGFAARIVEPDGNVLSVAVHGGFLSVTKDGVSILAEDAELRDEIDVTKARAAYRTGQGSGHRFRRSGSGTTPSPRAASGQRRIDLTPVTVFVRRGSRLP